MMTKARVLFTKLWSSCPNDDCLRAIVFVRFDIAPDRVEPALLKGQSGAECTLFVAGK